MKKRASIMWLKKTITVSVTVSYSFYRFTREINTAIQSMSVLRVSQMLSILWNVLHPPGRSNILIFWYQTSSIVIFLFSSISIKTTVNSHNLVWCLCLLRFVISARQHICYSVLYMLSPVRLSGMCLSVRPSVCHAGGSVEDFEVGSCNFTTE